MSAAISRLSNEPIWAPVRIEHPTTGTIDLSAATMRVAVVRDEDPVAADWNVASVEAGTWTGPDGEIYYVARYEVPALSLSAATHNVWVEVTVGGLTYVDRSGPIRVY